MNEWQTIAEAYAAQSPERAERVALAKQEAITHPEVSETPGNFWRVVCDLVGATA